MEVIGKIKTIGKTQSFGEKVFKKRELVVTTDEQYPQLIMIEFVQDKVDLLDKYKVGDNVKVGINLRGREWVAPNGETKYFNTIQGWNIFNQDSSSKETKPYKQDEPINFTKEDDKDDLPF